MKDITRIADSALAGLVARNQAHDALLDYVLYRAYTKDSEYAGNAARAQAHYAAFANALGLEIRATLSVAPTTRGNPNAAGAAAAAA